MRIALLPLFETTCVGEVFVDDFPCIIGRGSDCDVRLDHPRVSRRHCELIAQDNKLFVRDLGSHNGTAINERHVDQLTEIVDGDVLVVAISLFRVRLIPPSRFGSGLNLLSFSLLRRLSRNKSTSAETTTSATE